MFAEGGVMSNSIESDSFAVPQSLLEKSFYSFGKNVIGSRQVSASVSLLFGAILAQALNTPAGLFAAGTAYLLTENIRLNSETAQVHKWQRVADSNLKEASSKLDQIPELEGQCLVLKSNINKKILNLYDDRFKNQKEMFKQKHIELDVYLMLFNKFLLTSNIVADAETDQGFISVLSMINEFMNWNDVSRDKFMRDNSCLIYIPEEILQARQEYSIASKKLKENEIKLLLLKDVDSVSINDRNDANIKSLVEQVEYMNELIDEMKWFANTKRQNLHELYDYVEIN